MNKQYTLKELSLKSRLTFYFWYSVAIVSVNLIILGLVSSHTVTVSSVYNDVPLSWFEYTAMFFGSQFLPAIFGLFSFFRLYELKKGRKVENAYFLAAAMIGLTIEGLGYMLNGLSHIDCGNNCVNYVPSYTAINILFIISLPPAVILPFMLGYYKLPK